MSEPVSLAAWCDRHLPSRNRLSWADKVRPWSNDTQTWAVPGGNVCGFLSPAAGDVLVRAIGGRLEFQDDGTLDRDLIDPLIELYSVGFLARATERFGVSIYRVTDVARRRYAEWRRGR